MLMQEHDDIELNQARNGGEAERAFLRERRGFDRLLVPLSARCLNAPPDQLDQEIEQGLREVNSFFGSDRVILWEIADDEQTAVITHYHSKPGAARPPVDSFLQKALPYIFGSVRELKNLCVSSLEELPQDAQLDRQYLERSGIRSFMVIPLMAGGTLQGALSLSCLRTERVWSAEDLSRLQRIGSVISSALDRKRSHYLLERRMQFEELITDLSARLITASINQLDEKIGWALTQVREFFQADRCALLDIYADSKSSRLTHSSDGEGIEPVSGEINLAKLFPWCYEQLLQGKIINICRVEDYPENALIDRDSQVAWGIKSALDIPLFVGGSISRIIVINHTRRHQAWPEEYISRLHLLGDVFVNALERRADKLNSQEELRFETLLSEISTRFISLPAERIDSGIQEAQFRICELLDLDRSSLWQVPEGNPEKMLLTHILHPEGSPTPPERMDAREYFPWATQKLLDGETVIISRLTDLPPAADRDLESFRYFKTKSTVLVPLFAGEGPVFGLLGFASIRNERPWSENAVKRFKLIAQVFSNALIRKQMERELERELQFETLISNLSSQFINLPAAEVDQAIVEAEQRVCECLELDLAVLWQWSDKGAGVLMATHSYSAQTGPIPPWLFKQEDYPWFAEQLMTGSGRIVAIASLDKLPAEAARDRESCLQVGVKSNLTLPLTAGGRRPFGVLGLNTIFVEREWPDALVKQLQLVAQVFANALVRKRTEEALQKSEEENRVTFEQAAVGIAHVATDGRFLRLNDKFCALAGYEREEMMKLSFQDITHPDDLGRDLHYLRQLLDGKMNTYSMEKRYFRKDHSLIWINLTVSLVRDGTGEPRHFISVVEDITERKQMESNLKSHLSEIVSLKQRLESENIYLQEEIKLLGEYTDIVGQSMAMKKVLSQVEQVAKTDSTVLLQGETGTGKELLARAIHSLSSRKDRPLVTVNCASLPPTLIESELFGREKGAYTGALTRMMGRFEIADGSTLFLDEIGELPLELQSKLLRVLEDGTFERLGSTKPVHVNVRIIAATNRNLEQEVQEGKFRRDLFYRLNVFPVTIPPLRERPKDIPLLVRAAVDDFQKKMGKEIESIPRKTMQALQSYCWPGNVRELRNLIEHAMIVSKGTTLNVHMPQHASSETDAADTLRDVEKMHIIEVLEKTGWNIGGRSGAAEILGLKRTTLGSKMKRLGIKRSNKTTPK
jgi:formate hydrogenlyase transcriptional activator